MIGALKAKCKGTRGRRNILERRKSAPDCFPKAASLKNLYHLTVIPFAFERATIYEHGC